MSKKSQTTTKRLRKRDADGLFRTHCLACGATLYCASSDDPEPNCEYCPGHDEIARRDQESADRAEALPEVVWIRFENFHVKSPKNKVYPARRLRVYVAPRPGCVPYLNEKMAPSIAVKKRARK